ncbi:MAG: polysaccharide biosynthesis protein, partial [Lentisphaeraceae bacterium]|nr:polysaccharide biosynthesis protein [Lentisphaeraceae bacterium]
DLLNCEQSELLNREQSELLNREQRELLNREQRELLNSGQHQLNKKQRILFYRFLKAWPLRKLLIICWHMLGVYCAYYLAFLARFDEDLPKYIDAFEQSWAMLLAISFPTFFLFRQYSGMWRYYSIDDLGKTVLSCATIMAIFSFITKYQPVELGYTMSRTVLVVAFILITLWCTGSRAFIRYIREQRRKFILKRKEYAQRVLICGSVTEADILIRGCSADFEGRFCAILSPEKNFDKRTVHGVRVYHDRLGDIGQLIKDHDITNVHILAPFNKPQSTNTIIDNCAKSGVSPKFHTIPTLSELASGEVSTSLIRNVEVTDLLGRVEADLDRQLISKSLEGKKVMVTGAGGSIGSELCRQILSYKPRLLILFEFSEIALYTIEKALRELLDNDTSLQAPPLIAFSGDMRHPEEVAQAIDSVHGIDVIYHAAAYKHVPLMEKNIPAAFRNNVLGTARLADVAEAKGVKRFVMISSDKAVRPSNIMGATKRIAERCLQERPFKGTEFVAVRFGNVLGSSGSVVPLFKKLIKEGKALTVTSPDMCRFFMTIPEAVDLVLMSGAVAKSGQILVLEMGEPVKIFDLAVRLIELSGLTPHVDVKIEFCGLRPGEKEYEEILTEDENVIKTDLDRIWLMEKDEEKKKGKPVNLELIEAMVSEYDEQGLR